MARLSTAEKTFTAEAESGTVDMSFTFDSERS